jgi:hypothetical protein
MDVIPLAVADFKCGVGIRLLKLTHKAIINTGPRRSLAHCRDHLLEHSVVTVLE